MSHIQKAIEELRERIEDRKSELLELESAVSVLESLDGDSSRTQKNGTRKRRTAHAAVGSEYSEAYKTREEETEGPTEPDTPRVAPTDADNRNVQATDQDGIALGNGLGQPFTTTDLQARLDGDKKRSYNWVALWKGRGWIETCGFGSYRRTEKFGK
jgi:hypothetical protein